MTRDDIIRMAREAGFEEYEWSSLSGDSELDQTLQVGEYPVGEAVFNFAALVAAAEREACARVCEEPGWNAANWCAKQIRARGEKK